MAFVAGRVDDDEVVLALERRQVAGEKADMVDFPARMLAIHVGNRGVFRQLERQPVLPRPLAPVLDVTAERLLLHVEIEGGDAPARLQQRHDEMHGEGRLAAAALVVADHDDAWAAIFLRKLRTQHGALSYSRETLLTNKHARSL